MTVAHQPTPQQYDQLAAAFRLMANEYRRVLNSVSGMASIPDDLVFAPALRALDVPAGEQGAEHIVAVEQE